MTGLFPWREHKSRHYFTTIDFHAKMITAQQISNWMY